MKKMRVWRGGAWSVVVLTLLFSASAGAYSMKIRGSIIETACAIDVGSRDQTIDMGSLALTSIYRDGQGPARPFSIRLVNCTLARENLDKPNWHYFRVTFDGAQDRGGLFRVSGQAEGVGLQIQRNDGEVAQPGQPLSAETLMVGMRDLTYQLRLVANQRPLVSGSYYSHVRFKLDYE